MCRRFPESAAVAINLLRGVCHLTSGEVVFGTGCDRRESSIGGRLALVGLTKMSIQTT